MRRLIRWLDAAVGPLRASPLVASSWIGLTAVGAVLALILARDSLEFVVVVAAIAILAVTASMFYTRLLRSSRSRGYEVLAHEHEFDLVRPDGSLVVHRKKLLVRYLNDVISIVDFAWGEGDLFAEYSCDPGRVVDRFDLDG